MKLVRVILIIAAILIVSLVSYFLYEKSVRDKEEARLKKYDKETQAIMENLIKNLDSVYLNIDDNSYYDEITISTKNDNNNIKSFRNYNIYVGTTDVRSNLRKKAKESDEEYKKRLKKLILLSNVEELEYCVFFSNNNFKDKKPIFPYDSYLYKNKINFSTFKLGQKIQASYGIEWEMIQYRKLKLDIDATFSNIDVKYIDYDKIIPIYPESKQIKLGPNYKFENMNKYYTKINFDSLIYYSHIKTIRLNNKNSDDETSIRVFNVLFEPPYRVGWYHLRFFSRTNRVYNVYSKEFQNNLKIGNFLLDSNAIKRIINYLHSKLKASELPDYKQIIAQENFTKSWELEDRIRHAIYSISNKPDNSYNELKLYLYITWSIFPFKKNTILARGNLDFDIKVNTK